MFILDSVAEHNISTDIIEDFEGPAIDEHVIVGLDDGVIT